MYNKIYDFCKVRNRGNCLQNGLHPTPRVEFLQDLIDELGLEQELDEFKEIEQKRPSRYALFDDEDDEQEGNNFYNIILPGSSNRMVVAHHDIANPSIDNANDNSASCINALALKLLVPSLNVVLLDGEELGGYGSRRLGKHINAGYHGSIEWVLNLELTGIGGELFFIGDYPGGLSDHILSLFDCPVFKTPFNDSVTLRRAGIDSCVINPLPVRPANKPRSRYMDPVFMNDQELDVDILMHCHGPEDTVDKISTSDMKAFVEKVLYPIVTK
jgi:hypothetical protein